ncbi:MAG: sodium:calcium antiporter [Hyphomicrobiaceae bacterium]|nr:sodium:calcium antiporter [Hyphomicrobiaceae bacterium]
MGWLELGSIGAGPAFFALIVAGGVVWWAGYGLARHAGAIARATGLGEALIGVVLIAVIISLPEMTFASITAAFGHAELAVNSLIGGIAMSVVMLAIADAVVGPEPLSTDIEHPVVMMQGSLTVLMLVLVAAAVLTGDRLLPGIGLAGCWTTGLLALYLAELMLVNRMVGRHPWRIDEAPPPVRREPKGKEGGEQAVGVDRRQVGALLLFGGLVVAAGTVLAFGAQLIAQETGLAAGFVGLMLGGISTSLPELSTTISAARLKQFEMAFADVFGTNLCNVGLLFVADLLYPGGPILNMAGAFSAVAVLLGAALTTIYLVGMLVRAKRPILRMGPDSAIVLGVAAIGFVMLYRLQ